MLVKNKNYQCVVLIGSTSEIGLSILKNLQYAQNAEILLIGRARIDEHITEIKGVKTKFIKCDIENEEELGNLAVKLLSVNNIDLAIVAAGYLPPENEDVNISLVRKSMMVNSLGVICVLSTLARRMIDQPKGHILLISTVAAMHPRSRNFTYGASKASADFFARGLSSKYRNSGLKVSILRPGYVTTKMTQNFNPAPFATTPQELSRAISRSLKLERAIIYAPRKLRYVMNVFRLLPKFISDALSR